MIFSKVKHKTFRNYSGPFIKGTKKFDRVYNEIFNHWKRVVWLTSQVESGGKFGAVVGYDGTGCTAGIIQAVAVYPRELAHEDNNPEDDQGPLWEMLEYIRNDCPEAFKELEDEFKECNWILEYGSLWTTDDESGNSNLVLGRTIREEFTPNQGKVPKFGEQWDSAKSWALLFHNVFADPRSFNSQIKFGIHHAYKIARRRSRALRGETVEDLVYQGDVRDTRLFYGSDSMDLAMAVFFSNAVNAPAMAYKKLKQSLELSFSHNKKYPDWNSPNDRILFSRILIKMLGTSNFARWNFKIPNGRYQRTRKSAMKLWPRNLFEGSDPVMPRRLP